jgi:hypothetical protein
MKRLRMKNIMRIGQRGQALPIIALAVIGLAAFIGLATDAGILFTHVGHLRRAVDTAALAAANQFREDQPLSELREAAEAMIRLNMPNVDLTEVIVQRCEAKPGDPSFCPDVAGGEDPRKLVRVEAKANVTLAFMPIIGFGTVEIKADAISEAATVDLVLVIDTSPSMAYDADCEDGDDDDDDGVPDDCDGGQVGPTEDDHYLDPAICNQPDPTNGYPYGRCQPFEKVRAAALSLVDGINFSYDRVGVITFSNLGAQHIGLSNSKSDVKTAIENLEVDSDPPCDWTDPRGCTSTNTALGLRMAGELLGGAGRQEAVWVVILLSDGAANAAINDVGWGKFLNGQPLAKEDWVCPGNTDEPTWISPLCRDPWASSRHKPSDTAHDPANDIWAFDAEDAARYYADFVACDPTAPDSACYTSGQGAVIFSIGLGDLMINMPPEACASWYGGSCDEDLGEQFLRYVARVGDDGDPDNTHPCDVASKGNSCGNYYFSATGEDLGTIFADIASQIFTRLTH